MNKIISRMMDWLLLIAYVALIYSTLPLMPKVTAFFSSLLGRHFGLIANTVLIAIITAIFGFIFKHKAPTKKPLLFYIPMAVIFMFYVVLLLFALPIVAEKVHLLEYGFLSYLAFRAVRPMRALWKRYLYVLLMIVLVSYCDELIQRLTPGRYYELRDVILNIISGVLGLFINILLNKHSA